MTSTPQHTDDNWYRFGDPDSDNEEVLFDPDVDDVEFDSMEDPDE
jgi:hypothetical protein